MTTLKPPLDGYRDVTINVPADSQRPPYQRDTLHLRGNARDVQVGSDADERIPRDAERQDAELEINISLRLCPFASKLYFCAYTTKPSGNFVVPAGSRAISGLSKFKTTRLLPPALMISHKTCTRLPWWWTSTWRKFRKR